MSDSAILSARLGTGLSLQVNKDHVDRVHHYDLLWRQDLLDYNTGDFYSVRRLQGTNVSTQLSIGLLYSESSEQKISFEQTGIEALDVESQEPLEVEPIDRGGELAFTHPFFIRFPTPIVPGGHFDVVYAIRLPGELDVLNQDSEIMSVSLARITQGVDTLTFNVALNFEPSWIEARCLSDSGEQIACDGTPPFVDQFTPGEWFEEHFDIDWTSAPYIIRWSIQSPSSDLYIIHYKKIGTPHEQLCRRGRYVRHWRCVHNGAVEGGAQRPRDRPRSGACVRPTGPS